VGNWIDHLVLAAPSLDVGCAAVEALTGVAPVLGGVHPGAGTHNALLSLGPPTYLEVIARDPAQTDVAPSPLVPDDLGDEPRLVAFAVGCEDIVATVATLRAAGVTGAGDPYGMARHRPDGSVLSWRVAFVVGQRVGGATPFLISWDSGGSPAYDAPVGGRLVALRAGDPDPAPARFALEVLGVDVTIESSPTPRLEATITSPIGGALTLS
jgi:Glyoxalase-like domain